MAMVVYWRVGAGHYTPFYMAKYDLLNPRLTYFRAGVRVRATWEIAKLRPSVRIQWFTNISNISSSIQSTL